MSFLHLCNRSTHQEAQALARKTVTSALVEEILANAAQVVVEGTMGDPPDLIILMEKHLQRLEHHIWLVVTGTWIDYFPQPDWGWWSNLTKAQPPISLFFFRRSFLETWVPMAPSNWIVFSRVATSRRGTQCGCFITAGWEKCSRQQAHQGKGWWFGISCFPSFFLDDQMSYSSDQMQLAGKLRFQFNLQMIVWLKVGSLPCCCQRVDCHG